MAFTVSSTAFENDAPIPHKYTCDGDDISPPLAWTGVPEEAKSLALICDDPDAPMGIWVHWVLWSLPPSAPGLPEAVPTEATLPGGIKQGLNGWKKLGYGGPCPPASKSHRYLFKLYALDTELDLPPTSTARELEAAIRGHILAEGQIMGKYERKADASK
jgi:Raf kinase inhibitor-like YbhB/YbcL family protein